MIYPKTNRFRSPNLSFVNALLCRRIAILCCAGVSCLAVGCRGAEGPAFRLNVEGRNPDTISPLCREEALSFLEELFGTPDEPRVPAGVGLDLRRLQMAAGNPVGSYDAGGTPRVTQGLYRRYCAGCHGIAGDGAGPAALVMDPYPRDFRRGLFVYTSTVAGAKPAREDIRRAIVRGLPGSGMPGYSYLPAEQVEALVEYTIYLSVRGEAELLLIQYLVDEEEPLPLSVVFKERFIEEDIAAIWSDWATALAASAEVLVSPTPPPQVSDADFARLVNEGRAIYLGQRAQCATCHGPEGLGDGEQAHDLYDDWNYPKKVALTFRPGDRGVEYRLPLRRLRVRNLREDLFRGGSDAEDVYRRIYIGLKGTPMPGVGPSPGAPGVLSPEEVWHVVHFVQAIAQGAEVFPPRP